MRARGKTAVGVLSALVVALAACSSPALPTASGAHGSMVVGVYEPDDPGSYGQVAAFASAVGAGPGIDVYYSAWGQPFASPFAAEAAAHGAKVLVQLQPAHGEVGAVAAGRQDAYLRSYADQVRKFGRPVVISFGQEMNGPWYPWGQGREPPGLFTAAWRHMVDVFRAAGALNVIWLWDVNCAFPGSSPVRDWWPGSAYVTWAGVDCYYARPSDTFAGLFGPIIASVRRVTDKPLLIAETANGPDSGPQREAQIAGIFAGVKADRLLGFAWFDQKQNDGPYHQDWRLEDSPAALAAFRAGVKEYG